MPKASRSTLWRVLRDEAEDPERFGGLRRASPASSRSPLRGWAQFGAAAIAPADASAAAAPGAARGFATAPAVPRWCAWCSPGNRAARCRSETSPPPGALAARSARQSPGRATFDQRIFQATMQIVDQSIGARIAARCAARWRAQRAIVASILASMQTKYCLNSSPRLRAAMPRGSPTSVEQLRQHVPQPGPARARCSRQSRDCGSGRRRARCNA